MEFGKIVDLSEYRAQKAGRSGVNQPPGSEPELDIVTLQFRAAYEDISSNAEFTDQSRAEHQLELAQKSFIFSLDHGNVNLTETVLNSLSGSFGEDEALKIFMRWSLSLGLY